MVYRMLAVNIDGTLLHSNGRLHKVTREAVEYVHQKGVYVTLVTSRNFASAKKVAKGLKVKPLLVAHQGAYVGTPDKPILLKRISEEVTLELVKMLEASSSQIRLYHEKYMVGNRVNLPENLIGRSTFSKNEPYFYSHQYVDVLSETLESHPAAPPKIDVVCDRAKVAEDLMAAIEGMYHEVDTVKIQENKFSVVPAGISKWNGIAYLAEYLGIRKNEIAVIGDAEDDIEMIERAGLGVAMGNAPAKVKEAAAWATRTNDQLGVAYTLKEVFRKQQNIEPAAETSKIMLKK
ncbi:Cof-type HAD-IIB family hydrolase [Peribacillus kribbensis]|uniref:Cof-type HAD-IIB family hydrolase n=1 Tax=Peribacillus kribbensis TaxID=356658 RepID=UPI000479F219|nr:Cof-type HAD-IIB family hydrolase [Peribacillus kribbensis]